MVMELNGVQLGLKHMRNFKIKQVRSAKKMRFSAKNGAISKKIAPIKANQFARITSDFKISKYM